MNVSNIIITEEHEKSQVPVSVKEPHFQPGTSYPLFYVFNPIQACALLASLLDWAFLSCFACVASVPCDHEFGVLQSATTAVCDHPPKHVLFFPVEDLSVESIIDCANPEDVHACVILCHPRRPEQQQVRNPTVDVI